MIQDFPNYEQDATLSWDEKAIQGCLCDGSWTGPDCSLRVCPFGDDPVTQCDRDGRVEQVQQIRVYVPKKMDAASTDVPAGLSDLVAIVGDEFYLSFRDSLGNNYTTQAVNGLWGDGAYGAAQGSIEVATIATYSQDADAEKRIEAALEGLPNFAIRDVTVSHSSSGVSNDYIENKFAVTFHHLNSFQNNYGVQNLLACHADRPCPGAGCQPRVRQSYLASIFANDGDGGVYTMHDPADLLSSVSQPWVRFQRDSVVGCPLTNGVSESCTTTNRNRLMGALFVVYVGDSATAIDGEIWVRGMGANHADMMDLPDLATGGGAWSANTDWEVDADDLTANANSFTYVGRITSSNYAKIDISEVMPNSFLEFDSSALTAPLKMGAVIFFNPVSCDVVDVTESSSPGSESGLVNPDAENIECSGRGSCDRDTGNCVCFEGYSGIACEGQNTVV
jgi:EGF-like domain